MKLKIFVVLLLLVVTVMGLGCSGKIIDDGISTPLPANDVVNEGSSDNSNVVVEDNAGEVQDEPSADTEVAAEPRTVQAAEPADAAPTNTATTHTFKVVGGYFYYKINGENNPSLRVKQGDTVKIEFSSEEGLHDWVIDEFSAATKKVNPGTLTSVEFVADKKGTFEYYCSVGSHRNMGMKGNLVVE
ncbi:MAG TPA: cupredoxin domain-containing protein [Candidatus Nanoarchaeia archaeon]|nr:cupredoxin domain-containing protein [Candidatus Nanoarchaeia archaeon]